MSFCPSGKTNDMELATTKEVMKLAEPDKQQIGDGGDNPAQAAQQIAKAAKQAAQTAGKAMTTTSGAASSASAAAATANAAAATVNAGVQTSGAVAEIAAGTEAGGP